MYSLCSLVILTALSMANPDYQPLSGNDSPRFAMPSTYMRLPAHASADGLDVAIVGVPLDIGTSNRSGARHGPREIRDESRLLRPVNLATRQSPFAFLKVADIGDVALNTYDLIKSIEIIDAFYTGIVHSGAIPLSLGGDHTISYPILRALARKHGPMGLVHIDAHTDCNDTMFEERITHGTWLRRAVDEGIVAPRRTAQIGIRGTTYTGPDCDYGESQGFAVYPVEQCWHRSMVPFMEEIRSHLGAGPVYLTFDVDGIDPAFAPGTGTPEPGGLTSMQGIEIVRGCKGLDLIGADIVEVSPPWDSGKITSLLAATIGFEFLCALQGVSKT